MSNERLFRVSEIEKKASVYKKSVDVCGPDPHGRSSFHASVPDPDIRFWRKGLM